LSFGSFGAILATHVALMLKKQHNYNLKHLVVSGCVPLHVSHQLSTSTIVFIALVQIRKLVLTRRSTVEEG
jgi:surfactin synthase thioesterase subunit